LFRSTRPYLTQTVALGPQEWDGSRFLVISEPPPHVAVAELQALAPSVFRDLHVCRQWFGYDGWVKDVVVRLPVMPDDSVQETLSRLQLYLFGTTYKSYVEDLAPRDVVVRPLLDLNVTSSELRRWIVLEAERFSVDGGEPSAPLLKLLQAGRTGVFSSRTGGLVAWIVPRRGDLASRRRDARHFVLDSDLILGAIATQSRVAILGRQRVVSVRALPPLRVETILRLASAHTTHLAQSYERNFLYAGRYDEPFDWAPIFLSPDLIDTEYGSLLNLTDQLLKSWSEGGGVRYAGFSYPVPARWPFPGSLFRYLGGTSLTYNWNTEGTGYTDRRTGFEIYALRRTGALPISYLLEKRGADSSAPAVFAEDTAADYFAATNDPNIIRVVQYAALYQVWKAFNIAAITPLVTTPPDPTTVLQAPLTTRLHRIREANFDSLDAGGDSVTTRILRPVRRAQTLLQNLYEEFGSDAVSNVAALLLSGRGEQDSVEARQRRLQALSRRVLLANGDLRPTAPAADVQTYLEHLVAATISLAVKSTIRDSSRDAVRALYEDAAERPDTGWIRTGNVVVSWHTDSTERELTGGHNLDAQVTRFRASAAQPRGRVRVIDEPGGRVVLANPDDLPALTRHTRAIAHEENNFRLERQLNAGLVSEPPPVNRPRFAALGLSEGGPKPFPPTEPAISASGYGPGVRVPTGAELSTMSSFAQRRVPCVTVQRTADGRFEILVGGRPKVLRANSSTSALEAALSQTPGADAIPIQLRGFSDADARAFRTNAMRSLRNSGIDRDAVLVVERAGSDPASVLQELSADVDMTRASIDASGIVTSGDQSFSFVLEIPRRVTTEKSFVTRMTVFLKAKVGTPRIEWMRSVLRRVGGTRPAVRDKMYEAVGRLQRALGRADPNIDAMVIELQDGQIVRLWIPGQTTRSDRHAGQ
jgi:hypothetical protein